jgi:hypothetical protein
MLLIFLFCSFASISAQKKEEQRAKIKAQKVVFFNDQLNLTETESTAFWALYDDFQIDLRSTRREIKRAMRQGEESTPNYNAIVKKVNSQRIRQDSIYRHFNNELGKILPAEKVYKFYKAEEEFKRMLIKNMNSKHVENKK